MPPPRWLRVCWKGTHACGRCALAFCWWSLWLVLGLVASVQLYVLMSQELPVPDFALRAIETQLKTYGLHAEFGTAQFDPTGQILLRNVKVSFSHTPEPILVADSVYLKADPWLLCVRQLDIESASISGADLRLPAMLSPSGATEAFVHGLDASVRPGASDRSVIIEYLTTEIGPLPIDLHGEFLLPTITANRQPLDPLLAKLAGNYLQVCREVGRILPQLPPLDRPHLSLTLEPRGEDQNVVAIHFIAEHATTPNLPQLPQPLAFEKVDLRTQIVIGGPARLVPISLSIGQLNLPGNVEIDHLVTTIEALIDPLAMRLEPRFLQASARQIRRHAISVGEVTLQTSLASLPAIRAQIGLSVANEPLQLDAEIDLRTRAGRIAFETKLSPALLDLANAQTGRPVSSWISWRVPPKIVGHLDLSPGGRPLRAEADLTTGPIVAYRVLLDATSGHLTWSGTKLRAERALAVRGHSRATGTYTMDFANLDFQFLLRGHLEPTDINGWFRRWWPDFWTLFDFSRELAEARVEIGGQWTKPFETRVFVQAESHHGGMKGIEFDRMRTQLFVRPGWADVIEFIANRPMGETRGSFLRQWKMPGGHRWTAVELHAQGVSDLAPAPALLGELGQQIIAPFTFSTPLTLKIDGRVEREDASLPIHSDFALEGSTEGDWTFEKFPLHGVEFSARRIDEVLLIDKFSAGAARGNVAGRLELRGPSETQRLAFDLNLTRANLGESIKTLTQWLAERDGQPPPTQTKFEKQIADGVLDLGITAEGPANNPYGFMGSGNIAVSGADFGELNLLGVLSSMLRRTLLNFSTLQLNHAVGNFDLKGREVDFSSVSVAGPKGSLEGHGKYYLDDQSLAFAAKVRPFEAGQGLLDTVLSPLSNALEVKLGGKIDDPDWTFVYGPTNILRALVGGDSNSRETTPPVSPNPPESLQPAAPPAVPAPPTPDSADHATAPASPDETVTHPEHP